MSKIYSLFTEHAEAACCIWEALLERRMRDDAEPDAIVDCFEQRGTSEMRHAAISLAVICNDVWDALDPSERPDCFDWDFVPRFVDALPWDARRLGNCVEIPTVEEAVAFYRTRHGCDDQPTPVDRAEWQADHARDLRKHDA